MDDLVSFAGRLDNFARELKAPRGMVTEIAVEAKKDVEKEVNRALGDESMSGWRKIKFRSGFELTSDTTALLKPRPPGPWQVLEKGRHGGVNKGRGKGRRVMMTPRGLRTGPFRLGSTSGHRPWAKAGVVTERETTPRIEKALDDLVRKTLGG